jgi:hypothetical protein
MPSEISVVVSPMATGMGTSESSVPFAAVANCPAARSCSSIAAAGVFALEALRACDCAWEAAVSVDMPCSLRDGRTKVKGEASIASLSG